MLSILVHSQISRPICSFQFLACANLHAWRLTPVICSTYHYRSTTGKASVIGACLARLYPALVPGTFEQCLFLSWGQLYAWQRCCWALISPMFHSYDLKRLCWRPHDSHLGLDCFCFASAIGQRYLATVVLGRLLVERLITTLAFQGLSLFSSLRPALST